MFIESFISDKIISLGDERYADCARAGVVMSDQCSCVIKPETSRCKNKWQICSSLGARGRHRPCL